MAGKDEIPSIEDDAFEVDECSRLAYHKELERRRFHNERRTQMKTTVKQRRDDVFAELVTDTLTACADRERLLKVVLKQNPEVNQKPTKEEREWQRRVDEYGFNLAARLDDLEDFVKPSGKKHDFHRIKNLFKREKMVAQKDVEGTLEARFFPSKPIYDDESLYGRLEG